MNEYVILPGYDAVWYTWMAWVLLGLFVVVLIWALVDSIRESDASILGITAGVGVLAVGVLLLFGGVTAALIGESQTGIQKKEYLAGAGYTGVEYSSNTGAEYIASDPDGRFVYIDFLETEDPDTYVLIVIPSP